MAATSTAIAMATAIAISSTDFSPLQSVLNRQGYTPYSPSTFSFQEALRPLTLPKDLFYQTDTNPLTDNPPYLFTDSCSENGIRNCTSVCSDPTQTFRNLPTFHNCASYALIAQLWAAGNLSTTTSDHTTTLHDLGFLPGLQGSGFLYNMTSDLTSCLNSYCTTDQCKSLLQKDQFSNVFNSTDGFFDFGIDSTDYSNREAAAAYPEPFYFADAICALQHTELNPDIGGIGVFVSYWIQSGLALLGSVLVVWWGWGMYYCCLIAHSLRHGYKAGRSYARNVSAKYGNTHLPNIVAALAEFQKAQCFFMLAINIATQVNKRQGGFSPNNLQALYNNNALIKAISISGYLPITLTLLTLHTVGMVSWYLLILSIVTVIFSVVTSIDSGTFAPNKADLAYLASQSQINGTSECGGQNLLVYCLTPTTLEYASDEPNAAYLTMRNTPDAEISGGNSTMAFCIVVLALLTLHQTGLIKKLRITTTQTFFIRNFMNIRGVQFLLVAFSWMPATLAIPILFISAFLSFLLFYIFLTSNLRYERRSNWTGKLFNVWVVLTADIMIWVLALAYFNLFPLTSYSYSYESPNAMVIFGVALGILLWLSSFYTLILTSLHIHGIRRSRPKKLKLPSQYSTSRRRLEEIIAPIRQFFRPVISLLKSEAVRSHVKSFQRYMRSSDTDNSNKKILEVASSLLYVAFFVLYLYWFVVYAQYMGQFISFVDKSTWTFGQVVAITVWAQPLCEFFHLEFRGMTRGFQHRLMWPYKVVRSDEDLENGQPRYSPPNTPRPSAPADGGNQPKRGSKQAPSRISEPAFENPAAVGKASLSKDSAYSSSHDDPEGKSMLDQGRSLESGHQRSESDISLQQEQPLELELEPHRSYSRVAEADGAEIHEFGGQEGQVRELEHGREVEHERGPNERSWQIPESVLLRSSDLGFE